MYQAIVFLPLLGAILAGADRARRRARALPGRASRRRRSSCAGACGHARRTAMPHARDAARRRPRRPPCAGRAARPRARARPSSSPRRSCSIAMVLSWIAFWRVGFGHQDERIALFTWIISGDLKVDWALRIDTLTAVMLVVVTTVSALVHLYSIGYMAEDPYRPRFFCLSVALHLRHAGAGDGRQPGAAVLRLGGRRARELSADRLLVSQAGGQRGRDQGLRRQPRRRFRLRARHLRRVHDDRRRSTSTPCSRRRRRSPARPSISSAGTPTR